MPVLQPFVNIFSLPDDSLKRRWPLAFVGLVAGLLTPFVWFGARTDTQLLPGVPVSALMVVCPAIAASILVYHEEGGAGVRTLPLPIRSRPAYNSPILPQE